MAENIIIVLTSNLQIIYVSELVQQISIANFKFESVLKSDFIGFYDWLRIRKNQICGVRLIPFDFAVEAIKQIPDISNLKLASNGLLELYFTDVTNYDEEISCDQDFGSVKLYKAVDTVYAIGLNIDNLNENEKASLEFLFPLGY